GPSNPLWKLVVAPRKRATGRQVVEAMTTNETYFFREPAQYDALRTVLLPSIKRDRQDAKRLRVWSAAASTGQDAKRWGCGSAAAPPGQEAYSLAMLLLQEGFGDWNIQILGTDFSSHVL